MLLFDLNGSHTVVDQYKLCIGCFITSCYPWIAFQSGASQPEQTNQIPTGMPKKTMQQPLKTAISFPLSSFRRVNIVANILYVSVQGSKCWEGQPAQHGARAQALPQSQSSRGQQVSSSISFTSITVVTWPAGQLINNLYLNHSRHVASRSNHQ